MPSLPSQPQLDSICDRLWDLSAGRNAALAALDRNQIRFRRVTDFHARVYLAHRSYELANKVEVLQSSIFFILFDGLNLPGDTTFTILAFFDPPESYSSVLGSTGFPFLPETLVA